MLMDIKLILNKIKSHLNIVKDKELAIFLGVKPNTISTWVARNTIDYEKIMSKCDFLNANWLFGKGEMLTNESSSNYTFQEEKASYGKKVIEINPSSSSNTLIADIKASAGIGNIITDHTALEQLPSIKLPDAPLGLNIAFQIDGDSMHPTIRHLDYVAGNKVEDIQDIRSGYTYIIIDKDDGVLCKRIYKEGNYYQVVSDNPSYPAYKRSQYDILAFFRCFCRLSFDFRSYHDDVRASIKDINTRMNKLEQHFISK